MEKENNNKGVIILLIVIIVILATLCILFATGTISFKSNEVNDVNKSNEVNENVNNEDNNKYKEYSIGQEIKLSDNSKWIVLDNSDSSQDYVTILSTTDYDVDASCSEKISDDFFNRKDDWDFSQSEVYNCLKNLESKIPVNLKSIDGYEIRFIKISEILKFDNNWIYDDKYDTYNYQGTKINENLIGLPTMDKTKCGMGKCAQFYTLGSRCVDTNCNEHNYFISTWSVGIPSLRPVINVYKSSIVE